MQSISNPAVYAVGDAADTPFQLATTADMEAEVAADNIINGNRVEADYTGVASVVFTQPPLASVGMDEKMAQEKKLKFRALFLPWKLCPVLESMIFVPRISWWYIQIQAMEESLLNCPENQKEKSSLRSWIRWVRFCYNKNFRLTF